MDKKRTEEQKVQWNMDYDRHNGSAATGSTEKATVGVSVKLVKDIWQSDSKISLFQMSPPAVL